MVEGDRVKLVEGKLARRLALLMVWGLGMGLIQELAWGWVWGMMWGFSMWIDTGTAGMWMDWGLALGLARGLTSMRVAVGCGMQGGWRQVDTEVNTGSARQVSIRLT